MKLVEQIGVRGANVFLIRGDEGCVLVDTGNPNSESLILKGLAERDVDPAAVRLILITHAHVDHFGSAAALKARTGTPVAIHALDADALRQGIHQPDSLEPTSKLLAAVMKVPFLRSAFGAHAATPLEPDVVIEESLPLDAYDVAGRVIHTPGHTHGSVSVLLDSGEAIVGDIVMDRLMGLARAPGEPIVAWDLAQNRASVRALMSTYSPRTIYTGHGGPFSAAAVQAMVDRW
ncbi:MAG: MBL fold metallo-hydrolase [Anaerolineae bacterium]|nr:MBL fold metallo-hydrolase [Anaerolineae bacterium]